MSVSSVQPAPAQQAAAASSQSGKVSPHRHHHYKSGSQDGVPAAQPTQATAAATPSKTAVNKVV